jgi:EAL domain-containing protein (putative c-di-GMP-specific phosphodiesterase class I)/CHASE2 domain-containing sensor protein
MTGWFNREPHVRMPVKQTKMLSVKTLLTWLLVCALIGVSGISMPIELVIDGLHANLFQRKASGNIIFVGVDDKSLQASENGNFSRREQAKLIDTLNAAGVRRLFIDFTYTSDKANGDLQTVADAVKRMDNRIVMATRIFDDPVTGKPKDSPRNEIFGDRTVWGTIGWKYQFWMVRDLPLAYAAEGPPAPSFAALMANKPTRETAFFRPDYSFDLRSIPFFSAADIVDGKIDPGKLRGKQVIFAPYSERMNDSHFMPGRNRVPGAYFHIVGAETLMIGNPVALGSLPMLGFAALAMAFLLLRRFRTSPVPIMLVTMTMIPIVSTVASRMLITMESGAALIFVTVVGASALRNYRRYSARRESAQTGLPSLQAMRRVKIADDAAIIAARIVNFDDIAAYLGDDIDEVIEQARRRLQFATAGTQLYYDDNGAFAWSHPPAHAATLENQLAGLAALFTTPITVGERKIDVAIAFGINAVDAGSSSHRIAAAMVAADQALRTRSLWVHHTPTAENSDDWRYSFHSQLDEALASGGIWVAYQPQIDMKSGNVIGAEALARWTHPERGPIPPEEFIREAERSNDIYRLTLKVLDEAIQTAAKLDRAGMPISMAVNLSALLLDHSDIAGTIRVMLASSRVPADRLTIEITETARIEDSAATRRTLDHLRRSGVKLSIDDYGTGQSNLEYLELIEADEIKIDRSFVTTMAESNRSFEIVKSTIELAHRLGAKAVAEGIEDERTYAMLNQLGCDIGQGYLIGKPMIYAELAHAAQLFERSRIA